MVRVDDDRFVIVDEEGVAQGGFLPSLTSTALRGLRSITCLRPPAAFIATATCLAAGIFSVLADPSTPNEVSGFVSGVFISLKARRHFRETRVDLEKER